MRIEFDETQFKSEAEWRRINYELGNMDKKEAVKLIRKHGWKTDNALRVSELIEYLQTLPQDARLVYGEQNGAMLGEGYWQHMVDFMLPQCIKTVKKDKEDMKFHYVNDRMSPEEREKYEKQYLEAVEKDYKYVNDEDIIIQI